MPDPKRPTRGNSVQEDYGGFVVTAILEGSSVSLHIRIEEWCPRSHWRGSMKAAAAFIQRIVVKPDGLELLPPQN